MTLRLVIIADDLTGALDTAEPFANHGLKVAVATSFTGCDEAIALNPEILAINTDSRALPPAQAADAVSGAWSIVAPLGAALLFKKIDSRLKGNLAAEIATLQRLSKRRNVVVAPAIPSMRRIVTGGMLSGFGIETPLVIADHIGAFPGLAIPDCPDEAALTIAAQALIAEDRDTLAIGARGLAEAMAAVMGTPANPQPRPTFHRMLMLIGSRDRITLAQLDHLSQSGLPTHIIATPDGLCDAPIPTDARLIVLHTTTGQTNSTPEQIANNLGRSGWELLQRSGIDAILASGGDTAMAFVRAAGINTLRPAGALAPGIPYASACARDSSVSIITKSGGFGASDTLSRIAQTHIK